MTLGTDKCDNQNLSAVCAQIGLQFILRAIRTISGNLRIVYINAGCNEILDTVKNIYYKVHDIFWLIGVNIMKKPAAYKFV
jgi:hypothetical protein